MALNFSERLLSWYAEHGRDLPWRDIDDPYKIWLSEVILQQTQVKQGWQYYERFCELFPNVSALASAPLDDLMKAWEGLGYYSRAKNLHKAAKQVVAEHAGSLPDTVAELLKLPGIGPYTARAIAAFAFKRPVAVVDGNVYRVLARYLGDDTPIDTTTGKSHYQQIADDLLAEDQPDAYNHAIMDFGATLCTPKNPDCGVCPMQPDCVAYAEGKVDAYPVKAKKMKRGERWYQFFWVETDEGVLLRRRDESSFWKNLWELPNIEVERQSVKPEGARLVGTLKHEFTHFRMHIQFFSCQIGDLPNEIDTSTFEKIPEGKLSAYALPKAVQKLLKLLEDPQRSLEF